MSSKDIRAWISRASMVVTNWPRRRGTMSRKRRYRSIHFGLTNGRRVEQAVHDLRPPLGLSPGEDCVPDAGEIVEFGLL